MPLGIIHLGERLKRGASAEREPRGPEARSAGGWPKASAKRPRRAQILFRCSPPSFAVRLPQMVKSQSDFPFHTINKLALFPLIFSRLGYGRKVEAA